MKLAIVGIVGLGPILGQKRTGGVALDSKRVHAIDVAADHLRLRVQAAEVGGVERQTAKVVDGVAGLERRDGVFGHVHGDAVSEAN